MTPKLRFGQWIAVSIVAIMGGLAGAVVGLGVGADYGGNYCSTCEFNGQRGYEATGQIGFLVGAVMGLVLSARGTYAVVRKRNERRNLS